MVARRTIVSGGWTGVTAATGAVQRDPEAFAAAAARLGLAFLRLTLVLHQLARGRRGGGPDWLPVRRYTHADAPRAVQPC